MSGSLFGGSAKTVQTSSNTSPWAPQQPYLQDVFGQAQNLFNRGSYQSPFLSQMQQQGTDPNSATALGQRQLSSTIQGNYLTPDSNPYLKSSVQDALGLAGSAFAGQYGGAGGNNLGNSGYQEGLARTLGQVATNAYGQAYGQERQNQLAASQAAPGVDMGRLGMINAADMATQQAYMSPWSNLANYKNAVSGNYGGQTQAQEPYSSNPLANILGLGLGGFGLGKGLGLFGGG